MSGFSDKSARKRAGSRIDVARRHAARQQQSESFESNESFGFGSKQMMSQFNYGIAPLSDEEVRLLPVAHQYSS